MQAESKVDVESLEQENDKSIDALGDRVGMLKKVGCYFAHVDLLVINFTSQMRVMKSRKTSPERLRPAANF